MEILKIVSIGVIATVLVVFLRQSNREDFAILISIATGLIIFSTILGKLKYVVEILNQLVKGTNIDFAYRYFIFSRIWRSNFKRCWRRIYSK